MKVQIKRLNLVADWSWDLGDNDHCTICMNDFELPCPMCKIPGDDCPPIEGECGHIFHLHCIYKWLGSGNDKCPLDREVWKEKIGGVVKNNRPQIIIQQNPQPLNLQINSNNSNNNNDIQMT